MRTATLLLPLALVACQSQGPVIEPEFDPAVGPELDLAMTGGVDQAAHTEVAPGVFMLSSLHESGTVKYVPLDDFAESPVAEHGPDSFDPSDIDAETRAAPGTGYCYNYDYETYSDSTSSGSLFGGDTTWYGYAYGYSYDITYPTGVSYDYDYAYTYVYTYAPTTLDYVYSYGYVYINGAYAGYVTDYVTSGNYAYVYGSWETDCSGDGFLDVTVYTYHYGYTTDTLPSGLYTRQSLSINNTVTAFVECCP